MAAAGSSWSSGSLSDFYINSSPTNQGYVTCGGSPSEPYNGLTQGYALKEYDDTDLDTCASKCLAHDPQKCDPGSKTKCPYENACTGFYYWNQ